MVTIYNKRNDDVEGLIKRFKKKVNIEGILLEVKKRRYFTSPSVEKHEKNKKLIRKKKRKVIKMKKLY